VGCWTSLADHLPPDQNGNILPAKATLLEASNNIIYSPKKHVTLCGVSDLVVVETDDALMICHRDKVQDIKKILPTLPPELL
jgi:mannose-1-phosphate guanylyltransferase